MPISTPPSTEPNAPMESDPSTSSETTSPPPSTTRRKLLMLIGAAVGIAAVVAVLHYVLHGRFYESTDDAYANGNVIQITSQVSGTVIALHVDDTQKVEAGAPLVELDSSDALVALYKARAALAQAVRQTRTVYINNGAYRADIAQRQADLVRARSDLARRLALAKSGAISTEDIAHARSTALTAKAALDAAQQQLLANLALTDSLALEQHPTVLTAAAQLREAYLNFARTRLPAPVGGYVAKRSAQLGQRATPGSPLMAIVPLDTLWVDANFKEGQLRHIRAGQAVKLWADAYGSDVEFHGKVVGFSAGTGSAFSLLPAQNATGNWIKVVQRLPVRIALDSKELKAHPLHIGFSMTAQVDLHRQPASSTPSSIKRVAYSTDHSALYQTQVFKDYGNEADAEIRKIIQSNSGKTVKPHAKKPDLHRNLAQIKA